MERSDTELVTWLEANRYDMEYHGDVRKPWAVWESPEDGKMLGEGDTWREAVSAAMSASEAGEIEAAWKWFRESDCTLVIPVRCERKWKVYESHGAAISGDYALHPTREQAVLAAYRASKGK